MAVWLRQPPCGAVQAKTGATGAVLDQLSEQAREMGRTTVHSATEAARGQAFLAQAGFDANEVLSALPRHAQRWQPQENLNYPALPTSPRTC